MNKADLIAHIAVADGISKGAADKVVAVVFDVVAAALKKVRISSPMASDRSLFRNGRRVSGAI